MATSRQARTVGGSTARKKRETETPPVKNGFERSLDKLQATLQALPKDTPSGLALFLSGLNVYKEIRDNGMSKNSKIPEAKLTQILDVTTNIVAGNKVHPRGDKGYRKELTNYHRLSSDIRHFPFGKVLAGVMLALIGTAIMVASGIIAAASFGLLAPISLLGITIGLSTVVGGVACGVGALGMFSVMGSGIAFSNATKGNPIREKMNETEAAARAYYDFR